MRRLRGLALVATGVLAMAGLAAAQSAATADLSVKWVGTNPLKPQAGTIFRLGASLVNNGPDQSRYRLNVDVPAGVELIGGGSLECGNAPPNLHCVEDNAIVGDNGTGYVSFRAKTQGSYTFSVYLDQQTASDPDQSNNRDEMTVQIGAAQHKLAAGALSVRPAKPLAGSPFVVSFGVTDAGSTVAVSRVRCTSSIGHTRARVIAGRATCAVNTARSARGRALHGTLTASTSSGTVSRAFSVHLR